MIDLLKVLAVFTSLVLSLITSAEDTKILAVKNTDDGAFYDLYLETNTDAKAVGLKLYDRDLKDWTEYDIRDISGGIPIKEEGRHKVLVLKSNDFENDRGGHFKLVYLYNGITGARKELPLKIDFNGSKWQALYRGSAIKQLDFTLKKVWGQIIGIEKVIAK